MIPPCATSKASGTNFTSAGTPCWASSKSAARTTNPNPFSPRLWRRNSPILLNPNRNLNAPAAFGFSSSLLPCNARPFRASASQVLLQLRAVPAATKRFDQRHRRHQLLPAQSHRGPFQIQRRVLRGRHFEVRDQSGAVAIHRDLQRLLCRPHGGDVRCVLPVEQVLGREIVFHLAEGHEHALPILRQRLFINRFDAAQVRPQLPALKNRQRERRANRPKPAWPVE